MGTKAAVGGAASAPSCAPSKGHKEGQQVSGTAQLLSPPVLRQCSPVCCKGVELIIFLPKAWEL